MDAGFQALDPESLYLVVKTAAELSGSTLGLFSGEKIPHEFVAMCTGSKQINILSDAFYAVGAGASCPEGILVCDHK